LTKKAIKSSTIANKLNIPNPTVKRILNELISKNLIEKHGIGPDTSIQ
jgi:Mn-dependent DtxR family transcriptional regulator